LALHRGFLDEGAVSALTPAGTNPDPETRRGSARPLERPVGVAKEILVQADTSSMVSEVRLNVLLVEDSAPDAALVRGVLGSTADHRIELSYAQTLAVGLQKLAGGSYDAVLLDLSLPDAQGMEALEKMLQKHSDIPIVVMTGREDAAAAALAMRQGAQDYLVKGRWEGYHLERAILHAVERKRQEERIRRAAFFDELTGLPNRALLLERIQQCITRHVREPRRSFALILLDLDRFKRINDTAGHVAGDTFLVAVAERLKRCVRPSDTVARLGGDEFVLLLEETRWVREALRVAERVHDAMSAPFEVDGQEVFSSVSAGVAFVAGAVARPDDVLRQADMALYRAKAAGRGLTELFDIAMQEEAVRQQRLESLLRRASEREEFIVRYQPIAHLEDGSISGFEALVRWRRPGQVELPPSHFLGAAEETGVIHMIRSKVLRDSCAFLRSLPNFERLSMSVNLSNACFQRGNLVEEVPAALEEADLPANNLRLEITEGVLLEQAGGADRMKELRSLGVRWHLDDFGTGYSSLVSLEELPIDGIKIDRRFVSGAWMDGKGPGLVRSIAFMAQDLGLELVAEGIETENQLAQLKKLHCAEGQGFLLGRPMLAEQAAAALANSV
jgi:diguanylate cyclase (GGDEF)-like protein